MKKEVLVNGHDRMCSSLFSVGGRFERLPYESLKSLKEMER